MHRLAERKAFYRWLLALVWLGMILPVHVLGDLVLFSDNGCAPACIGNSWASADGPAGFDLCEPDYKIPVSCTEFQSGTDAVKLQVPANMQWGNWYNLGLAFADWGAHDVSGLVDLRFHVKNGLAQSSSFNVLLMDGADQSSAEVTITMAASADWAEQVIPLSRFTGVDLSQIFAFVLSGPVNVGAASQVLAYIDNVRFTDGSGTGPIGPPEHPGGTPPAGWPDHLAVGILDRTGTIPANRVDYRWNYLNWDWENNNHWNDYVANFASNSQSLGTKSAFAWYFLTAMEPNQEEVVHTKMNDASFMQSYFDTYEGALNEMAATGQEGIAIILEPDMYGFIMLSGYMTGMDATTYSVRMERASALAGSTYENNLKGYCEYMVRRAHQKMPTAVVGHTLSHWGVWVQGGLAYGSPDAHVAAANEQAAFLNSLGANGKGDIFFVETSDRDAGQKAAEGDDSWFWNSDNYDKYFVWVRTISYAADLRACGWQIPVGNMNHADPLKRDETVQYFVDNPQDWVNGGFVGVFFGPGADGANFDNDNGWFISVMTTYHASPQSLDIVPVARESVFSLPQGLLSPMVWRGDVLVVREGVVPLSLDVYTLDGRRVVSRAAGGAARLTLDWLCGGMRVVQLRSGEGEWTAVIGTVR